MAGDPLVNATWASILAVIVVFVAIARKVSRKRGTYRNALIATTFDLHARDQRRALSVIAEDMAEYRHPESADDTPEKRRSGARRRPKHRE